MPNLNIDIGYWLSWITAENAILLSVGTLTIGVPVVLLYKLWMIRERWMPSWLWVRLCRPGNDWNEDDPTWGAYRIQEEKE